MKYNMQCVGMTRKLRFEGSVISYGNQTTGHFYSCKRRFEGSVISYGNQTQSSFEYILFGFESNVISYGNQTIIWMDLSE